MDKRILVAEDEKPLAKALARKLEKAGFVVSVVENGDEALALLKEEQFDLIFLDLVMPVVDGFGVLSGLSERKDTTPVVVLSNLSQEGDEAKARQLGARDFFIKSDTPVVKIIDYVDDFFAVAT